MGFITELLSTRPVNLARPTSYGHPMAPNSGIKSKHRLNRQLLEDDYRFDATTFNIINKQLQLILHAGFDIKAIKKMQQKFYDEFFDSIGSIGEMITSEELTEYIFQDLMMYGNSYVELIYDAKTDSKVVDLKTIPEYQMDYAKNSNSEIAVDEFNRPIGYVMVLPSGISAEGLGDPIPAQYIGKVSKDYNEIFLLPKRIAHFKLFTYGDRFYGIGLIEPSHQATSRKLLIEDARSNEIYTRGANTIVATVGDENHEAGKQELEDTLEQISNFKHDRFFAFPHWVKLDTLPIADNESVDRTLDYLTTKQASAAGMPKAFATGSGEATNRATLNNQQQIMELSLEYMVRKFCASFNKLVLDRIAKSHKKDTAKIIFGDVRAEEKNEKSKRLIEYVKAGIIKPEAVTSYAISSEDLDEPSYPDNTKVMPKENKSDNKSQAVKLGGFYEPVDIDKNAEPEMMDDENVVYYHDSLHIIWEKLEQGYKVPWTFRELFTFHSKIIKEMMKRGLPHLEPINKLDTIRLS